MHEAGISTGWQTRWPLWLAVGLAVARVVSLLSMPLAGLRGYGDFIHFYNMASLPGWPFFNYWVEFPPVFSFLSALLFRISGGQQHVYDYLLFFILTAADAGNIYLFSRMSIRLHARPGSLLRAGLYLLVLLSVAYGWWYFDALAVFFFLLGLSLLLEGREVKAGLMIGAGILTKLFTGLVLLAAWRRFSPGKLAMMVAAAVTPALLVWGSLVVLSPDYSLASLRSQSSKGSWETVWALLDGNLRTGNFGDEIERLDPTTAAHPVGNPSEIAPWFTLIVFGIVGLVAIWRIRPAGDLQSIALLGFGWTLFLLWSPGWSPQWILYLLPLVLLVLPERMMALFAVMLVLVNLLEWPILLSRGFFWALPMTVILRTLLLALLAVGFYEIARLKIQEQ